MPASFHPASLELLPGETAQPPLRLLERPKHGSRQMAALGEAAAVVSNTASLGTPAGAAFASRPKEATPAARVGLGHWLAQWLGAVA
jgi:hypothetical protein